MSRAVVARVRAEGDGVMHAKPSGESPPSPTAMAL